MALSTEELLAHAHVWGFLCEEDELGVMWMYPSAEQKEDWKLCQRGDRWILFAHNTAQLNFYADDVLRFLRQRRGITKKE
jgi:hypothetical protein